MVCACCIALPQISLLLGSTGIAIIGGSRVFLHKRRVSSGLSLFFASLLLLLASGATTTETCTTSVPEGIPRCSYDPAASPRAASSAIAVWPSPPAAPVTTSGCTPVDPFPPTPAPPSWAQLAAEGRGVVAPDREGRREAHVLVDVGRDGRRDDPRRAAAELEFAGARRRRIPCYRRAVGLDTARQGSVVAVAAVAARALNGSSRGDGRGCSW